MKNKFVAKIPAETVACIVDSGPHEKISQIVRLVSEIVLTYYSFVCVTKGLGTGPLPRPRNVNWTKPRVKGLVFASEAW